MSLMNNHGAVQNQVGGSQNIQGSLFFGTVNNITHIVPTETVGKVTVTDAELIASLAFPEMFDRRSNIEQPHEDTCRWILDLELYRDWCSKPSGLLWIKGKPGAGKSTLMLALSQLHREHHAAGTPHVRLDYFFNARGTQLQHIPVGMLRSLTIQLIRQDPASCINIKEEYVERYLNVGETSNTREWQRRDLERLFMQALLKTAQKRSVTIFVDALDEAGQIAAREVAHYFHQINDRVASQHSTAKICISSRHYPIPSSIPSAEIWVEHHNGHDIAAFVQDHLRLDQRIAEDVPDLPEWQRLAAELIQAARGVFQWIRLIVPLLQTHLDDGESPQDARIWLRRVPRDLSEVYDYILCKVIDKRSRKLSLLLFQWVCLAKRLLSLHELRYAMAFSDAIMTNGVDVEEGNVLALLQPVERLKIRIKSLSGGLLETFSPTGNSLQVQIIHQSVGDHMISQGLKTLQALLDTSDDFQSRVDTAAESPDSTCEGHGMIFWTCLCYLSVKSMFLLDSLGGQAPSQSSIRASGSKRSWKSDEFSTIQPVDGHPESLFLLYTIDYLFEHALAARNSLTRDCCKQIELLTQSMPGWRAWQTLFRWRHCLTVKDTREPQIGPGHDPLHLACDYGITVYVKHLLANGSDVNSPDSEGYTALHRAARSGHLEVVEILVDAGADVNAQTRLQLTPLVLAIVNRHDQLARWLLERLADVKTSAGSYGGPLQSAAQIGDLDLAELLINKGADVNAHGGRLHTPLQAAAFHGNHTLVEYLLRVGADINASGGFYGTALHAASFVGREQVVEDLLKAGARVQKHTTGLGTPLQALLSHSKDPRIARMLIEAGADIDLTENDYGCALHVLASRPGYFDVTRWVISAGADTSPYSENPLPGLFAAVQRPNNEEKIRALIASGVNVNAKDKRSLTPLHLAAVVPRNVNNIRTLLSAGAYVNARDCIVASPMHYAACTGCFSAVQLLLGAGADVNARGGPYTTALVAAMAEGHQDLAMLLLSAEADVNINDTRLGTALHVAISRRDTVMVKALIKAGASVNEQLSRHLRPLSEAIRLSAWDIVDVLKLAGATSDPRDKSE